MMSATHVKNTKLAKQPHTQMLAVMTYSLTSTLGNASKSIIAKRVIKISL